MKSSLYYYFLTTIFRAKNRQRLLIISIVSLILSSMALVIIQSVMGGLQHGLISRSKSFLGDYVVRVKSQDNVKKHIEALSQFSSVLPELEFELLLKNESFVQPAIVRGIDLNGFRPKFLKDKEMSGIVLGSDLVYKLKSYYNDELQIISPSHVDLFFEEIPRSATQKISDLVSTEMIEIDSVTAWVRIEFLQNLARSSLINQLRLYKVTDREKLTDYINRHKTVLSLISWEEQNKSLVWALGLESKMMLFLFLSMCFLVSITITTGFVVFFDKLKVDFTALWILGTSKKEIKSLGFRFSRLLSFSSCLLGVLLGTGILLILDKYPVNFMPDIFVQRNLPVRFEIKFFAIAFLVPFGLSYFLTWYSQRVFLKQEVSFLNIIKKSF